MSEPLRIPFGKGSITLRVPATAWETLSGSVHRTSSARLSEVLQTREFRRHADSSTLCIVNDGTRPTRTREIIERGGMTCDYIVATGAHARPSQEEISYIFGPQARRKRILVHDAIKSPCRFIGETHRKTPVRFNNAIYNYERLLVVGSVEPHYFAGFTGGRKGLLPGVAAYETIERNHALYFSEGPAPLVLQGNPVHEDMMEAVELLDVPVLSLNMVLNPNNEIVGVFCGSLDESLKQAAALARSCYSAPFTQKADLVIACAPYPMDADLYQSHKALLNASYACKPDGRIVLVSECRNGVGPSAFYELMQAYSHPQAVIDFAREHYTLGYHKAASFSEIVQHHSVGVLSSLPEAVLHLFHMEALAPQDIESEIVSVAENGGTSYFMPHASITVPSQVPSA